LFLYLNLPLASEVGKRFKMDRVNNYEEPLFQLKSFLTRSPPPPGLKEPFSEKASNLKEEQPGPTKATEELTQQ
jgi:hypothetical protein